MLFADIDEIIDGTPSEKPQTHADLIRAMSDVELVKLFGHNSICDYVQDHSGKHCEKHSSCDGCLLEWLKQPAEGDGGNGSTPLPQVHGYE